jgi:NAD(P)-dependent dehydrogenase (short-subunit alcohol dehydrogenase family)
MTTFSNNAFQGKTAIVAGGSRGIGKAIGERLAAAGAAVAINYLNSATAAEEIYQHRPVARTQPGSSCRHVSF